MTEKKAPKSGGPGVEIRAAYTPYDPDDYATHWEGESMTKQSFAEACDINTIMSRYQKTGVIDHYATYGEQYGELSGDSFTDMMFKVVRAQDMFDDLPSAAREYFDHDPAKFLDYVSGENVDPNQLAELGLMREDWVPLEAANDPQPAPSEVPENQSADTPT